MSTSRFTAFDLHLIMWSIFKEHFHYNEPFNLVKVDTCFSLIVFAHFLEYPLYFCLYQETPTWKNPTQEIPPGWIPVRKIPTWNIPTHAFEYCHPRFLMFLFFHCHRYHRHYLKGYFVVVYFKSAAIRNSGFDVWKNCSLPANIVTYWSSMIIGHYYKPPACFECFYLWSFS